MSGLPAVPTLADIEATAELLRGRIAVTPVLDWEGPEIRARLPEGTRVNLKLELFQHTGSFKARGALAVMLGLDAATLRRGVTAVSAGNHAIAVAWAAGQLGTHAKVVMFKSANPARIEKVRRYGGEVVIVDDVAAAFEEAARIEREEGRTFVHPYEGPRTALGTATLGREWLHQAGTLDAVIVPIGGGGLMAGIATAVKALRPATLVLGVEPEGADSMRRSFLAGSPQKLDRVRTIADSLGAPFALPYSYGLCRAAVDDIVTLTDAAMRDAMLLLFDALKLACEPAGAAATAALLGPLRERLAGLRVGVIVCGSNIDLPSFVRLAGESTPPA
jgi:threonine dehydratase